jgi:hypothetical protein
VRKLRGIINIPPFAPLIVEIAILYKSSYGYLLNNVLSLALFLAR